MAITKKLIKFGNSYGLVIDKAVLELLGINADTLLEISTSNGSSLLIRPVQNLDTSQERFKNALDKVNKKYAPALTKLAEGYVSPEQDSNTPKM